MRFQYGYGNEIELEGVLDPHSARAKELDLMGEHKKANRIRMCCNPKAPFQSTCKLRECPTCGEKYARRNARRAEAAMRKMKNRIPVLITLVSKGLDDASQTIREFRKLLPRLRRRKCFAAVVAGVGGLELKLTTAKDRWNVHAHIVIDAPSIDEELCSKAWRKMSKGMGTFSIDKKRPRLLKGQIEKAAAYNTKSRDWCPQPGTVTIEQLAEIRRSIFHQQLLIQWPRKRKRSVKTNAPEPIHPF